MKIYDCFTFFNELELLELRLMTLYDTVDYFVLVEVGTTFTGKNKELYFENNKSMFNKYLNKIIHVKIDKLPIIDNNAIKNEWLNRNLISNGLDNANDEDYIIISDVDEILNPTAILQGINNNLNVFKLKQKLFYYYVNCLQKQIWVGPVIIKKKLMKSPQDVRNMIISSIPVIENGGWHYSFIGGKDRIKSKLESYAETQTNNSDVNNDEHILECLETGRDLFYRNEDRFIKKFISLEEINHKNLTEWLIKYPEFIKL